MKRTTTARLGALAFRACIAISALSLCSAPVAAQTAEPRQPAAARADFGGVTAPEELQNLAHWAVRSGDHKKLPFVIIDKVNARLYAFDSSGQLMRATPVLIGMGIGDTFPPGVMNMDMYETKPWQRITPAGRFEAEVYEKGGGRSTVWVDYDAGIALHKMPTRKTAQRRAQRMASPRPADHRITYGCINVPGAFYDEVVYPAFKARGGIAYILPEKMPLRAVFRSGDMDGRAEVIRTSTAH